MEEIMVSICCLAYNHEKYIRKCLEGFVNQKCNFKFEVLIHDDASTDKTADIIREYEEKFPDIIKPIYQTENQYSKNIDISRTYQFTRVKGKYVAFCEGDDYWIDTYKLAKQVEILEKNKCCVCCIGKAEIVTESGEKTGMKLPSYKLKSGIIMSEEIIRTICLRRYPFHTSTYMFKSSILKECIINPPKFFSNEGCTDVVYLLLYATKGDFFYLGDSLSHYRSASIGSWSLRMLQRSKDEIRKGDESFYKRMYFFDEYTGGKYHTLCLNAVEKRHFERAVSEHNNKVLVKKENRKFFKYYSLKLKIKTYLEILVPGLIHCYNKIKNN